MHAPGSPERSLRMGCDWAVLVEGAGSALPRAGGLLHSAAVQGSCADTCCWHLADCSRPAGDLWPRQKPTSPHLSALVLSSARPLSKPTQFSSPCSHVGIALDLHDTMVPTSSPVFLRSCAHPSHPARP